MPGHSRATPGTGVSAPGLLDEGPYLNLDLLYGNQDPQACIRDRGSLAFDNPDPSFSRGVGVPHCGPDNSAILERMAAGRDPSIGGLGGPTPGPDKKFELPSWLSPAGVGGRIGGWRIGGIPVTSTSGALDDVGQRDRAARQQQSDAAEAHDRRSVDKE